jgi:hypothetical protein
MTTAYATSAQFDVTYPTPSFAMTSSTADVETTPTMPTRPQVAYNAYYGVYESRMLWGRTYEPVINNGSTATVFAARFHESNPVPLTAGNLSVDSATTGPNKGYKYFPNALSLSNVFVRLSPAVNGDGDWADDQDGDFEGGPDSTAALGGGWIRYCNADTIPSFWSTFRTKIEKHEGSVSGETSHFDYMSDAVNYGKVATEGFVLQRMRWRAGVQPDSMLMSINRLIRTVIWEETKEDHHDLDLVLSEQLRSTLECAFDNTDN